MPAPTRDAAAAQRGRTLTEALGTDALRQQHGLRRSRRWAAPGGPRHPHRRARRRLRTPAGETGGLRGRPGAGADPAAPTRGRPVRSGLPPRRDRHRDRPARRAHALHRSRPGCAGSVAVLPFLVEQYGPAEDPQFLVTKTAADLADVDPTFEPGVVIEWWNGVPLARAVEVYADRETGGRRDSRRARALETLTFRALDYGPPPDEHWVVLGYRTARGAKRELRLPWRVLEPRQAASAVRPGSRAALKVRPPIPPPRRCAGPRSCCSHRTPGSRTGTRDPAALGGTGRGRRENAGRAVARHPDARTRCRPRR